MVLWEITLATAYILGLKRTYKLALKIQRRLLSKHPRSLQFAYRRIRTVFDMAVKVHKNIQERDIEVGRNLGNWILRWLDRMKPSAEIRGGQHHLSGKANSNVTKQLTNSSHQKTPRRLPTLGPKSGERQSDRHLFTSSTNMWRTRYPTIAMMISPVKPAGIDSQYRRMSICGPQTFGSNYGRIGSEGVIRKDIAEWMLRN